MKKTISLVLSTILILLVFPISVFSTTDEMSLLDANVQSNKSVLLNNSRYRNTISHSEYPIDIRAEFNSQTGLTTCRISFNSNFHENGAYVQVYTIGGDNNAVRYSAYSSTEDEVVFFTYKTEHVISIDCNDYVYIGALMLYESGVQDVSYDINMSKFTIIDFNPELSIYRTLSADSIDDLKSVSSVQVDSILSDGKRQIFYEEALSDKCTYYFKIENGGLANIQFQSQIRLLHTK